MRVLDRLEHNQHDLALGADLGTGTTISDFVPLGLSCNAESDMAFSIAGSTCNTDPHRKLLNAPFLERFSLDRHDLGVALHSAERLPCH